MSSDACLDRHENDVSAPHAYRRRTSGYDRLLHSHSPLSRQLDESALCELSHVSNCGEGSKYKCHDWVVDHFGRHSEAPAISMGDTNTGAAGIDEESPFFNEREKRLVRPHRGDPDHLGDRRSANQVRPCSHPLMKRCQLTQVGPCCSTRTTGNHMNRNDIFVVCVCLQLFATAHRNAGMLLQSFR